MNKNEDTKIIKLIMANSKLNQTELANQLDTTKQYIGQIVNGKRGLGYKTRNKLVSLFPDYFKSSKINIPDIIDNPFLRVMRMHYNLSQDEMAKELGISTSLYTKLEQAQTLVSKQHAQIIRHYCETRNNQLQQSDELCEIQYLPEVKLSAGYGADVYNEDTETVKISKKLLLTEKGLSINPKYCKIVTVSGDSMLPEYRDGDRVIIDESIKTFIDGHVFAFGLDGQCYIKLVNVLPDRIKCIPLNEKYDTFYLSENDNFTVFGMILPRIRL